jgi:hypothetical protein
VVLVRPEGLPAQRLQAAGHAGLQPEKNARK